MSDMHAVTRQAGELLGSATPWPAPAKLNLCLHIVGRRADGYHLLQSAIQFISLCDDLVFYARPAGVVERLAGPADVPPESDLVVRAGRLLAGRAPRPVGVGIELHKRIPMQAGLGGGSSDAATVLVALNELWDIHLATEDLATLGATLGADVPVFVHGLAAWVEGVGEVITPADYPENVYLVLKPAANVSTAEIFSASELTRNTPITTIRALRDSATDPATSPVGGVGGQNDCTATVCGRYPEVADALDWLDGFYPARLTGTGACVFAAVPDTAAAEAVRQRVPGKWQAFVVQGLNRSPLRTRLEQERASKVAVRG